MKDIKELLKDKDLTFGTERTIKRLRIGDVKSVFIAKNCPENVRKTIKHYAKLVNVEVNELDIRNEELGVICKKPFSITVLSC